MPFIMHILYLTKEDAKFDMTYYTSQHMPLAEKLWNPHGLVKWELVEFGPGLDGKPGPYAYGNTFTFKDAEAFKTAMSVPEVADMSADIAIFTNMEPVFVPGGVIHASST